MASDEKIKKFANDFCCSFWKLTRTFPSDDIANRRETDTCLMSASWAAMFLYNGVFVINASNDYNKNLKTKKDFSTYIRHMCNCENWMGKPSIFERVFASLTFVLVCTKTVKDTSNNIKRYAPTFWEEYFMEHIEEFYSKGGWGELRRLAISYGHVFQFLWNVSANPYPDLLTKTSKSVENYLYFIANRKCKIVSTFVKSIKIEYGDECKTSATLWIQFIVKNCEEQSFSNSCTQPPKNPSEVTCLMRVLRCLCCPYKLEDRKFDSNLNHELEQKSNEWPISPLDKNQETSRIQTELCTKGMLQHSGKQSNDSESLEQSCSSSMNNRLLVKTAIEKEHNDQLSGISSFTEVENRRSGKNFRRRKDTYVASVETPAIKINSNNWAIQKVGETDDEFFTRLERVILGSNKDTSTGELRGKCKNKFKKKNSEIPKND